MVAGSSPSSLRPLGEPFRFRGFETAMRVTTAERYVAVVALDGRGVELGRSQVAHA